MLLFDGEAYWFHSVDDDVVRLLFDWIDALLAGEDSSGPLPAPPPALAEHQFTASTWQDRPDGALVDDHRPRSVQLLNPPPRPAWTCQIPEADAAERAVAIKVLTRKDDPNAKASQYSGENSFALEAKVLGQLLTAKPPSNSGEFLYSELSSALRQAPAYHLPNARTVLYGGTRAALHVHGGRSGRCVLLAALTPLARLGWALPSLPVFGRCTPY